MIVSPWAYPTLLTLHGLGMAVVVGLTVMVGLRVLGFPSNLPLAPYIRVVPLALFAFAVNASSGIALFVADAVTLSQNPAFLFKICSIIVGLFVFRRFYRGPLMGAVAQAQAGFGEYVPTRGDKVLAITAMAIWVIAVIGSGRLIAYMAPEF